MKNKILEEANKDIPLYFSDFESFWKESIDNISDDDLAEIYGATLVYKNWKMSFHNMGLQEYDIVVNEIFEDINSSFFLSLMGLYRSAHMHLRSSIELTFQLIYFIHHPIEYMKWKDGNFVIKHDTLTQYIKGNPMFDNDIESLINTITTSWKKFSKHIHGESPIFFQCEKDARKTNSFSVGDFNIWKGNYMKNIYLLNKLLLLFFKNKLNQFPSKSRDFLVGRLKADDLKLIES